jgi:hypothetical protein
MIRARIELILAALFAAGAVATIIWPTWIESLTGLEPDKGTGEAEWWLVALLGVAALGAAVLARRDLRAARLAAGES